MPEKAPIQIARLTDPAYLALPAIQGLFKNAFAVSAFFPKGWDGLQSDTKRLLSTPETFVIIGIESDEPLGLVIIILPQSQFMPLPQIFHFYNGGSLALRKKLTKATVEIIRANGYVKFQAINSSGRPDSVWARAFRLAGTATVLGSIVEFDTNRRAQ